MGQRKLGQHTKAVFYKNVSQQRTKKGTNLCLVLSPLILCGLLFGLQLAINFLFLDRPEFRCGCKCVDCCVTTSDGNEECYVDRPDICLVADRCTRRDTSECTIAYSTPQQFGFCEIKTPYRWPSQLQLNEAQRRLLGRVSSSARHVSCYEDPALQAKARAAVPIAELRAKALAKVAAADEAAPDALLRELHV